MNKLLTTADKLAMLKQIGDKKAHKIVSEVEYKFELYNNPDDEEMISNHAMNLKISVPCAKLKTR